MALGFGTALSSAYSVYQSWQTAQNSQRAAQATLHILGDAAEIRKRMLRGETFHGALTRSVLNDIDAFLPLINAIDNPVLLKKTLLYFQNQNPQMPLNLKYVEDSIGEVGANDSIDSTTIKRAQFNDAIPAKDAHFSKDLVLSGISYLYAERLAEMNCANEREKHRKAFHEYQVYPVYGRLNMLMNLLGWSSQLDEAPDYEGLFMPLVSKNAPNLPYVLLFLTCGTVAGNDAVTQSPGWGLNMLFSNLEGFHGGYKLKVESTIKSLLPEFVTILEKHGVPSEIIISGHSQGGGKAYAYADFFAILAQTLKLWTDSKNRIKVYPFSPPPSVYGEGVVSLNSMIGAENIINMYVDRDRVPQPFRRVLDSGDGPRAITNMLMRRLFTRCGAADCLNIQHFGIMIAEKDSVVEQRAIDYAGKASVKTRLKNALMNHFGELLARINFNLHVFVDNLVDGSAHYGAPIPELDNAILWVQALVGDSNEYIKKGEYKLIDTIVRANPEKPELSQEFVAKQINAQKNPLSVEGERRGSLNSDSSESQSPTSALLDASHLNNLKLTDIVPEVKRTAYESWINWFVKGLGESVSQAYGYFKTQKAKQD